MEIDAAIRASYFVTVVMGILGFCGAILLVIGNGNLEKANAFFNKSIFSVGPAIQKGDENIANIDKWLMKRSRLVGIIALIVSVLIILCSLTLAT